MIIDSHIHLTHAAFDQTFPYLAMEDGAIVPRSDGTREQLIEKLQDAGIAACVEPAIGIGSNSDVLALAHRYPDFIYPAVGIHPTRIRPKNGAVKKLPRNAYRLLQEYVRDPLVVAVGETGLDYHYPRAEQYRFLQKIWFVRLLRLAHRSHLPVILHIREADRDALRILKRFRRLLRGGVCHCFNGTPESAAEYCALGLMIGVGGSLLINSPGKAALEQAVRELPLTHLLLETDAPYVRPACAGLSKKQLQKIRNTGLILPAIAKRVAELRGISVEEVFRISTENAIRLFRLPIGPDEKSPGSNTENA